MSDRFVSLRAIRHVSFFRWHATTSRAASARSFDTRPAWPSWRSTPAIRTASITNTCRIPTTTSTIPSTNAFSEVRIHSRRCAIALRVSAADKFTVAHVFDRSGRTFVPNVSVHVKSIVAERTYAAFSDFLNPYLSVFAKVIVTRAR